MDWGWEKWIWGPGDPGNGPERIAVCGLKGGGLNTILMIFSFIYSLFLFGIFVDGVFYIF
jgi:hypothetical protein